MNTPPEITEAMRNEAAKRPGGYVYCIDPRYAKDGADGAIPPQGILGAYPVDERGVIVPEFMANPNYVPLSNEK